MGLNSGRSLGISRQSPTGPLVAGRSLRNNLHDAMAIVPLKKSGYFAEKSSRKGTSNNVRVFESSNPIRAAYEFQSALGKGYVSYKQLGAKGHIMTLADGTMITFRYKSSSDGSPVVEMRIKGLKRVKSQKIHFVLRSDDAVRI